jgi:hypothetical protein
LETPAAVNSSYQIQGLPGSITRVRELPRFGAFPSVSRASPAVDDRPLAFALHIGRLENDFNPKLLEDPAMSNKLETINTDKLVTATGGYVGGFHHLGALGLGGFGGVGGAAALANANAANNQNTQMMTMAMCMAMANRPHW